MPIYWNTELKSHGLIALVEEISQQDSNHAVSWLLLIHFILSTVRKKNKHNKKGDGNKERV